MRRALLHTPLARTALETALLALGLLVIAVLTSDPSALLWIGMGGPMCMLWAVLRLRLAPAISPRLVLLDALLALAFGGGVLLVLGGLPALGRLMPPGGPIPAQLSSIGVREAVLLLTVNTLAFGSGRLGLRILLIWLRLRTKRYIWSLTQSILAAALLVASPFVLLLVSVQLFDYLRGNTTTSGLVLSAIPLLAVIMIVALGVLIVVLPAALVVAFFVARRLTRRLDTLTAAADELRAGNYAAQIDVQGEDEIAQLQRTFNEMARDLDRAVREVKAERDSVAALLDARRHLIASVSHELRTPIATLRGYLDTTLDRWDSSLSPATLHHDLETMQRETARLQSLIDDLFTLSRAEVGHLDVRPQITDLNALVRRCAETITPSAWRSGRVEVLTAPAPQPALALVDAARTEQIVYNLLHNAVRHTGPGGIVVAGVLLDDDSATIEVKDTGEGIAPDDLPHIWERFYRAANQRAGSGGTGLGLALVKEIAEMMGGSVAVSSVPGQGSSFSVRFARVPEAAPAPV